MENIHQEDEFSTMEMGEVTEPHVQHANMLRSVRICNFRVFGDLAIESLSRVNLITGRNNSGKTSLLEALFLLSGAGSPHLAVNPNVVRGMDSVSGPRETIRETFWKPMFSVLDMNRNIEIKGVHSLHGELILRISPDRPDVIELPFDGSGEISAKNMSSQPGLLLSFKVGAGPEFNGRIRVTGQGVQIDQPNVTVPFDAVILSTRIANVQEDATRLGRLRKRKQGDLVLDALQIIEPRLQSIEDNSASGIPMIWGDIGLPELVPLAAMGEGMTRIARLVLAISTSSGGLVLVDEVETGLHHSVLPSVWQAVDEAARQFGTQIIATTHSYRMRASGRSVTRRQQRLSPPPP